MKLNKVRVVCFSPTHTSRKVAEAIARGTGLEQTDACNVTLAPAPAQVLPADELVIVSVPVYGGHVAPLALKRLEDLKADGTPVVAVVVYGNRAYEKALIDLDGFLSNQGFKVIAGGTFIGEHSYSTPDKPIAAGRPDADDLAYAELFGQKLRTKIEEASDLDHLYPVDVRRIQRPSQSLFGLIKFVYGVIRLRKSALPIARCPETDTAKCSACGLCAKVCPTGAISPEHPEQTDPARCIRCCACVKVCKKEARHYETPFAELLYKNFKREKQNRIIL